MTSMEDPAEKCRLMMSSMLWNLADYGTTSTEGLADVDVIVVVTIDGILADWITLMLILAWSGRSMMLLMLWDPADDGSGACQR